MVNLSSIGGPSDLAVRDGTAVVTCTDALSKGDVVLMTLASGGYAACSKSVSANTIPANIIGVALADVAAGATGLIGLQGVFDVNCAANMDANTSGSVGTVTGQLAAISGNPTADGTAYIKMVGIALADTTTAGDLTSVLFDGINGFSAQAN